MTANPPHPGRCLLRPTATPAGLFWLVTRVVAVPPVRGASLIVPLFGFISVRTVRSNPNPHPWQERGTDGST
jgi:hypothetical protein